MTTRPALKPRINVLRTIAVYKLIKVLMLLALAYGEVRLSDASLIANHEFDRGALNLGTQLQKWADFPVLAANYLFEDPSTPGASPLGDIVKPFTVFDVQSDEDTALRSFR